MAITATCVAQTYTDYGIFTSSDTIAAGPNWEGGNVWAVDVNNDGIPDLVQEEFDGSYAGAPTPQFAVSIANGDGTFLPPVGYNTPPGFQGGSPIAFVDFNGDGKVDLAMWGGSRRLPFTWETAMAHSRIRGIPMSPSPQTKASTRLSASP